MCLIVPCLVPQRPHAWTLLRPPAVAQSIHAHSRSPLASAMRRSWLATARSHAGAVPPQQSQRPNPRQNVSITTIDEQAHKAHLTRKTCPCCAAAHALMTSPVSTAAATCADVAPSKDFTCTQQKAFGKCNESFMKGYCNRSCGRCSAAAAGVYCNMLFQPCFLHSFANYRCIEYRQLVVHPNCLHQAATSS
jgi:hypothetical protein